MNELITTFSLTNMAGEQHSCLTFLKACTPADEHSVVLVCLMLNFGSVSVMTTSHRVVLYKMTSSSLESKCLDVGVGNLA